MNKRLCAVLQRVHDARGTVKEVAAMLESIHAGKDAQAAKEKARQVGIKLRPTCQTDIEIRHFALPLM